MIEKNNQWVNDYKKRKKKENKSKEIDKIEFLENNNKLTEDEKDKLRAMRLKANHYRKNGIYNDEEIKIIKNHYWDLNKMKIFKRIFIIFSIGAGLYILVNI
jgi:hypothetical protein